MSRTRESHRNYKIKWKVATTTVNEGPLTVYTCSGIPAVGASWSFGGDVDVWAKCTPEATITLGKQSDEGGFIWYVEQLFSTEPLWRCQTAQIEDPLLEPVGISGNYQKFTRERDHDRHGNPVWTSAHELMKGPATEVDESRQTVILTFNTAANMLSTFSSKIDTVNDATLWGYPKRCIKLATGSWQRKFYGTCSVYYTTTLEFHIKDDTFDRELVDRGTYCIDFKLIYESINGPRPWTLKTLTDEQLAEMVSKGQLQLFTDPAGNAAPVILDGKGRPWKKVNANDVPPKVKVEYHDESNFLLLDPRFPTTI